MQTEQILGMVRKKILEESEEILSTEQLLIYANMAYLDLQMRIYPKRGVVSVQIPLFNGVGQLPTDYLSMATAPYKDANNVFPLVSLSSFRRVTSGNASCIQNNTILVLPTDQAYVNIDYYPKYADLSLSQDPEIPVYFQPLLVPGTQYQAYEDLQDEELADKYESKYEARLAKKLQVQSKADENMEDGNALFNGIDIFGNSNSQPSTSANYW